jgi:hypothetical protein
LKPVLLCEGLVQDDANPANGKENDQDGQEDVCPTGEV